MIINFEENQYLSIMHDLVFCGDKREGRNGGTRSLFGRQMRFNLSDGFPLLTTKKVRFNDIAVELLWFLRGDTNVKYLRDHGVTIWDEWADDKGDLGPVYGRQWRSWEWFDNHHGWQTLDQIANLIKGLKNDPYGRRHIVSAWNPAEIEDMALPPCHCLFQFYVSKGKLSCHLYQRSADWFLGVPYNIASYALLTHLVAREVGLEVDEFVHSFGDLHIYENHVEQAILQLGRMPFYFPKLLIDGSRQQGIFDWQPQDFSLHNYRPHPAIKAEVSA